LSSGGTSPSSTNNVKVFPNVVPPGQRNYDERAGGKSGGKDRDTTFSKRTSLDQHCDCVANTSAKNTTQSRDVKQAQSKRYMTSSSTPPSTVASVIGHVPTTGELLDCVAQRRQKMSTQNFKRTEMQIGGEGLPRLLSALLDMRRKLSNIHDA
jgi:hypothetical protein